MSTVPCTGARADAEQETLERPSAHDREEQTVRPSRALVARIMGVVIFASLCAACSRSVAPEISSTYSPSKVIPLKAALVISPELSGQVDSLGSFATMGAANKWQVETGEILPPALEDMARATFREVEVVSTASEAPDAQVSLVPSNVKYAQLSEQAGFWVALTLHARIDTPEGVRLDKTYREEDEGSTAKAVAFGAMAASSVWTDPVERVTQRVLEALHRDIVAVDWSKAPTPPKQSVAQPEGATIPRGSDTRLKELKSLLDQNLITPAEYQRKRAEILKEL